MSRRVAVITFFLAALTAAGAIAIYIWDDSQRGTIADGITIGGIDVGGLAEEAAEDQVRTHIIDPLERPVSVEYGDKTFELSAERLNVRADVEGMVDEALEASDEGGIFGRSWRRLTGGEVEEAIEPQILYARDEIDEFADEVAAEVNREPVNASVEPTSTSLDPVPSRDGRDIAKGKLVADLEQAIETPGPDEQIEPEVETVKPDVTTDELASQYPDYIVVDRANFTLRHYENLELVEEYTVAIGAIGFDTPTGLYSIQNMAVDPVWNVPDSDWAGKLAGQVIPPGPDNPLKARWMGIYNGAGIHGTDATSSLGSAASHGCVRMAIPDVIELYDRVSVGTPIYIS